MGNDVSISSFVYVWGYSGVKIGDRVKIVSNVSISSLTHNYPAKNMRFALVISK